MKTTHSDPVIAEVHRVRDANAPRFDYDAARLFWDIGARQRISDRKSVRYPPHSTRLRSSGGLDSIKLNDLPVHTSPSSGNP